jgi:hypothetical protein
MANENRRFIVPVLFSLIGIYFTFRISQYLAHAIAVLSPSYDLVTAVSGNATFDINFILIILLPVFLVVFLVLALPIAFLMLLIAKALRVATYDIGIIQIGHGFDWLRMMKRAAVPSLFALSLGELVISLLQGVLFRIPPMSAGEIRNIVPVLYPIFTLFGALLALTVSIAFFSPTWLLNDSGIVTHVKTKHLEMRRCPHTEGVGRWYSNILGGFGILTFPIAMFNRYFYQKFIIADVPITLGSVMTSLGWTVGLPFMVMAFVLPIIMLNEFTVKWTSPILQRLAKALGANEVQFERVEKTPVDDREEPTKSGFVSGSTEQ